MDKNIVLLEGRIGNDFKYGKTTDGKKFATFSLVITPNTREEIHDDTERHGSETYIRVMCFDKRQVDYLVHVKANCGHRVAIYARLASHKTEYRGIEFIQNNVVVRDISVLTTKPKNKKQ